MQCQSLKVAETTDGMNTAMIENNLFSVAPIVPSREQMMMDSNPTDESLIARAADIALVRRLDQDPDRSLLISEALLAPNEKGDISETTSSYLVALDQTRKHNPGLVTTFQHSPFNQKGLMRVTG